MLFSPEVSTDGLTKRCLALDVKERKSALTTHIQRFI